MKNPQPQGKLKIAFMFYDGANYIGGPMVNGLRLSVEFKNRGHEVLAIILAYKGESVAKERLVAEGVDCRVKDIPASRQSIMRWVLEQLKGFGPDVFVPNICLSGLFAAKWVKRAGIPTIAVHRSDDERNWLIAKHFGIGNEWKTSGLVCVSRYLLEETRRISSGNFKARVIPSGVPVPSHQAAQEEGRLGIVYTGRLVQLQKNIYDVFDVFCQIVNRFDNVECAFLGENGEKPELMNRTVSAGLQDKIRFYGFMTGEAYQEALSANHVIILLSDYEGTPGSIMDGMACGLIPICKRYSGIDELVINGETGFIVDDKNDVEAVVSQLMEDMALRKKISENARRHIIQYYSITRAADLWESFFYDLIEKKKKKRRAIRIPLWLNGRYPENLTGAEPPSQLKPFFSLKGFSTRWLRKIQSVFAP